jgi:hypothetical protein
MCIQAAAGVTRQAEVVPFSRAICTLLKEGGSDSGTILRIHGSAECTGSHGPLRVMWMWGVRHTACVRVWLGDELCYGISIRDAARAWAMSESNSGTGADLGPQADPSIK